MKKEYLNITDYKEMGYGFSFDKMVEVLLSAKKKGDLVYCSFNGVLFYSDTITENQAYLKYYDMLKKEKEYYKNNKNEIAVKILSSFTSRLCIPDELFKNFTCSVIYWSKFPDELQVIDYIIKLSENIFTGDNVNEIMLRFKGFSDDRKNFALKIINKYFDNKYKNYFINVIGLENNNKKRKLNS